MALDIFALLTSDGDHAQADHMFTGKAGDIVAVADVLVNSKDKDYCNGKHW